MRVWVVLDRDEAIVVAVAASEALAMAAAADDLGDESAPLKWRAKDGCLRSTSCVYELVPFKVIEA